MTVPPFAGRCAHRACPRPATEVRLANPVPQTGQGPSRLLPLPALPLAFGRGLLPRGRPLGGLGFAFPLRAGLRLGLPRPFRPPALGPGLLPGGVERLLGRAQRREGLVISALFPSLKAL